MKQLSTSFILPLLEFNPLILNSYSNTYLGHALYEGIETWGQFFYLEVPREMLDPVLLSNLRNHNRYVSELDDEEVTLFVFEFSPLEKEDILKPFLLGKYSEISKSYTLRYFQKYTATGDVSKNWRILRKDKWDKPLKEMGLREYWFRRIGQTIPKDAEVWPKPKMEDEIYGYYDKVLEEELADLQAVAY